MMSHKHHKGMPDDIPAESMFMGEYWFLTQDWPNPLAVCHNMGKVIAKTVQTK